MNRPMQITQHKLVASILEYLDGYCIRHEWPRYCRVPIGQAVAEGMIDGICPLCGIPVDRHSAMDLIRQINMAQPVEAQVAPRKPGKARKSRKGLAIVKTSETVN